MRLWPGRPAMRVVSPKRSEKSAALVVFRGGGYATSQGSGAGAAEWAAENGMLGVEVPYRTRETGDSHPSAFVDAARAVRLVRSRADVDPERVGVLGFSAGGHLASLVSTQPSLHVDPADDLAHVDARPNFVLLAYPVISFLEAPGALAGSAENFFGSRDVGDVLRRAFSNELHVTPDHPPVFAWTTEDDVLVPASHARRFAEACERAGVPVRLVVFDHGPHGMGLARDAKTDVATWPARALEWLRERGVL